MLAQRKRARARLLLLLGVLVAAAPVAPAGAQEPGIDLVVLIDQSGSMWGHPEYHPAKNDKWSHRIGGVQEIVLRLLDDVGGSPRVHRFSIVDFGDEAEVPWSDQVLRFDPADPEALRTEVSSWLERRIRAKEWINTNTPLAMEQAAKELEKMAAAGSPAGRRRIVLIVTDGRANLPGVDRATMRNRVRRQAEALKAIGAEIWVVGLNDADYYWLDGDGDFWAEVAGVDHRARLAERASTSMPEIFYELVDGWLGTSGHDVVGNTYDCPPYRSRLVFRVNFGKPRGQIRILDPEGFELTRTAGGPGSDPGTYAHFVRNDPVAGTYTIEKDSDRHYVIRTEWLPPKLERLQPAGVANLETETRLVFQATDEAGTPLEILPEWPIEPSLEVVPPGGTPQELPVEAGDRGKFEAVWTPLEAGVHRMSLRGRVRRADGSDLDIFASTSGPFVQEIEVSSRQPYWIEFVEPEATGGFHATPWNDSVPLELALVDGKSERVADLAAVVREPETWLQVELIDSSGVPLGGSIPLTPTAHATFHADLPLDGKRLVRRSLLQLGDLRLRLRAEPERLEGDHYLSALRLPPEVEDLRVNGDAMTAGPLPVYLSGWLVMLAGVLLLGLLVLVGLFVTTRTLPSYQIQRRDAAQGGKVELKVFDVAADPTGAGARAFQVSGKRQFKLDGQVRPLVDGQVLVADSFRVTRLNMPGKARARIQYRWQGEKRTHTDLLAAGSYKSLKGVVEGKSRTVALLTEGA